MSGTKLTAAERTALIRAWPWPEEAATTAHGFADVAAAVERIAAARLFEFVQWVSVARAYNGSEHHHGQSLYNEGLNGVLHLWASQWLQESESCHCGAPIFINNAIESGFTRGLCEHCDAVRCDVDPRDCGR